MIECFKRGLIWKGLIHDLSKFLPSEFFPYARFFHNIDGTKKIKRDKTGYYKPIDTGDMKFDFAWLLHLKRNRHHWQWWIISDENDEKIFDMDNKSLIEMFCDWIGAGKVQRNSSVIEWWNINKSKIKLHQQAYNKLQIMIDEYIIKR